MLTNEEDIKDLEKYTFTNYWKNKSNFENFSQINSFTNNFILNYQPPNINNKQYNRNIEHINNNNKNVNTNTRDINYNHININHYQKIPIKKKFQN